MKIAPKKITTRAGNTNPLVRVSPLAKKELVKLAKENGVSITRVIDHLLKVE